MGVRIESFGGQEIHDPWEEPLVPPPPAAPTEAEVAAGDTQAGTSVSSDSNLTLTLPSTTQPTAPREGGFPIGPVALVGIAILGWWAISLSEKE